MEKEGMTKEKVTPRKGAPGEEEKKKKQKKQGKGL